MDLKARLHMWLGWPSRVWMPYYIDIKEMMLLMRRIRKEKFLESLQMCTPQPPQEKAVRYIGIVLHALAHVKQIFKIRL